MAGVAGGPIVDLATGEVIGIHHSGKYEGGAKKLGFGVPVMAIEALLKTPHPWARSRQVASPALATKRTAGFCQRLEGTVK